MLTEEILRWLFSFGHNWVCWHDDWLNNYEPSWFRQAEDSKHLSRRMGDYGHEYRLTEYAVASLKEREDGV